MIGDNVFGLKMFDQIPMGRAPLTLTVLVGNAAQVKFCSLLFLFCFDFEGFN